MHVSEVQRLEEQCPKQTASHPCWDERQRHKERSANGQLDGASPPECDLYGQYAPKQCKVRAVQYVPQTVQGTNSRVRPTNSARYGQYSSPQTVQGTDSTVRPPNSARYEQYSTPPNSAKYGQHAARRCRAKQPFQSTRPKTPGSKMQTGGRRSFTYDVYCSVFAGRPVLLYLDAYCPVSAGQPVLLCLTCIVLYPQGSHCSCV